MVFPQESPVLWAPNQFRLFEASPLWWPVRVDGIAHASHRGAEPDPCAGVNARATCRRFERLRKSVMALHLHPFLTMFWSGSRARPLPTCASASSSVARLRCPGFESTTRLVCRDAHATAAGFQKQALQSFGRRRSTWWCVTGAVCCCSPCPPGRESAGLAVSCGSHGVAISKHFGCHEECVARRNGGQMCAHEGCGLNVRCMPRAEHRRLRTGSDVCARPNGSYILLWRSVRLGC